MDPKNAADIKLDPAVTQRIKAIIEKDLSALTDDDKLFLRARKSYLGRSSRDKFASVLSEKAVMKKDEKPQEPVKTENAHPAEQEEETDDTTEDDNVE